MQKKDTDGFTLVELSIVLVIIGLLIGGILVAQSMINTAKINGVVRDISQYEIAVENFRTRYGQLPGDSTIIDGSGDNNGYISGAGEMGGFWHDLSLGLGLKNVKKSDYQLFGATDEATILNAPKFNIDQLSPANENSALLAYSEDRGSGPVNYFYYINKLGDGATPKVPSDAQSHEPLKPIDALAIDTKIDDGVVDNYDPEQKVIGISKSIPPGFPGVSCNYSGVYNLNYNENSSAIPDTSNPYVCSLMIRFGTTNSRRE